MAVVVHVSLKGVESLESLNCIGGMRGPSFVRKPWTRFLRLQRTSLRRVNETKLSKNLGIFNGNPRSRTSLRSQCFKARSYRDTKTKGMRDICVKGRWLNFDLASLWLVGYQ